MICSSENRERFIRPSPLIDGLYQNLEEVQGLRSQGQTSTDRYVTLPVTILMGADNKLVATVELTADVIANPIILHLGTDSGRAQ